MILEIDSVELSFAQKRILYGIYLKAETGKVTGVLGRNGSGKTSLLRIIFGDLKPKYQSVRINSKVLQTPLFQTNRVAYLPQHKLIPKQLKLKTVFQLYGIDYESFIRFFDPFKSREHEKISNFSSGELRVIETYLVLNSGKEIIILDEPFSFIAPVFIEKIKELIQLKKKESAILITDHFYRDILDISDTIYLLKDGYSKQINSKVELKNEGYLNFIPPQT